MNARDHFATLGLPRRWHLPASEIEARYHAEARQHHPDKHAQSEARVRVSSALRTAELTEAYRTLRDATRRAEHLLALEGIQISDEKHAQNPAAHRVSQAFLVEILELREALEEAREARDDARVAALGEDVRVRQAEAERAVDEGFTRWEAGERAALPGIADQLVAMRYYRRFLDELEAHEEQRLEEKQP